MHMSLLYFLFLCLAFFIFPKPLSGQQVRVITAKIHIITDCSAINVQAAINDANDGDIVELSCTGTVIWNATITIPGTKGITIKGPGTNTPKTSSDFPLTIISNQVPAMDIRCNNNLELTRLSGLKFQGGSSQKTTNFITVTGRGRGKTNLGAFRIDNCYFDSISLTPPWPMVILIDGDEGELTGLVDNCTFHEMHNDTYTIGIRQRYTSDGTRCYGYDSWHITPFTYGDNRFIFVEDCLFQNFTTHSRHTVSSDGSGGRYVVRHNTFIAEFPGKQPDYIDAHGDGCYGLGTGARGGEIYANTFMGTKQGVSRDIVIRGGQWLIYDNTFTTLGWIKSPMFFTEYRAWTANCHQSQFPSLCNPSIPKCVTSEDFDSWYPLPGQIQGTYVWNNLYGGVNQVTYVVNENYVRTYIKENRDYWVSDCKPDVLRTYKPYIYPHQLQNRK